MFTYRMWQASDLPWLMQAAAVAAWESLSDAERAGAQATVVAQHAHQQVEQALSGTHGTAIIAQVGQQPVGFALIAMGPDTTTDEMHGYILSLWVAPQHRRKGAARQLQSLSEGLFAQMGLRKVKVVVDLHNRPWTGLAQRQGYLPEGLIGMKVL